jgi:uncharacterized membrane protein YkvI
MNRNWFNIAAIYIGTIIGAGFASGREIIDFFGVYGYKGIWGALIAGGLFSFLGTYFLIKVHEKKINGYKELIYYIFGKKLGLVIDTLITLSLFLGFCIMLAGSGTIFRDQLKLSYELGVYIMAGLCFFIFIFSIKGVSLINSILVPMLVIGIIFLGAMVVVKEGLTLSNVNGITLTKNGNWLISSVLYVSFNSLLMIVVLLSLLPIVSDRKTAIKGGLTGGIVLGILIVFILVPMLILYTDVSSLEIPMLKVCDHVGKSYKTLYSFILWIAMFTTSIANGFGFIERVSNGKNNVLLSAIFCILSIPFAKIGFSKLVSTVYPVFGYLGIIVLLAMFCRISGFSG